MQANQWMIHCQEYFCQLKVDDDSVRFSPTVLHILQDYHSEATKFSLDNFSTLNQMVLNLNSPRELQHWNGVWQKCQQTKTQLEELMAKVASASEESGSCPPALTETPAEKQNGEDPCAASPISCCTPDFEFDDGKPHSAGPFSKSQFPFPFSPESGKLSPSLFEDTDSDCTVDSSTSCHSEPIPSPAARHRKQPLKKLMKKTVSYELTPRDKGHSDAGHQGYTGVYIKGLEVTNNVCVEQKLQRTDAMSPTLSRSHSLSSPSRSHSRHSDGDIKRHSR